MQYRLAIRKRVLVWILSAFLSILALNVLVSFFNFQLFILSRSILPKFLSEESQQNAHSIAVEIFFAFFWILLSFVAYIFLVLGSYVHTYNWLHCLMDKSLSFTFLIRHCTVRLLLYLISAVLHQRCSNLFSYTSNFKLLDYSWLPGTLAVLTFYGGLFREKSGRNFDGSCSSMLGSIIIGDTGNLSAIFNYQTTIKPLLTQSLFAAAIANLFSVMGIQINLWASQGFDLTSTARIDLTTTIALVIMFITSGLTAFSFHVLLSWLHLTFNCLVIAHPMDFSLVDSSNESTLTDALQLGLFPHLPRTAAIGQGFPQFSSAAVEAIAVRSLSLTDTQQAGGLDAATANPRDPDWLRALDLMRRFGDCFSKESASTERASCQVSLLTGLQSSTVRREWLSLSAQHCRALAFDDLCRLSSSGDKTKTRRVKLLLSRLPLTVFTCSAVIAAAAVQVPRSPSHSLLISS